MGRTIAIWAVIINIDGIIVIKFIIRIDINNGMRKLFLKFLFVKLLNSEDNELIIFLIIIKNLDIFFKNGENKAIKGISHLVCNEKLHGSNIENKLVIMKYWFF